MSKKKLIQKFALQIDEELTVEWLKHRMFYGYRTQSGEVISLKIDCSKSTINRALKELVEIGAMRRYMKFGHCYDHWRYIRPTH